MYKSPTFYSILLNTLVNTTLFQLEREVTLKTEVEFTSIEVQLFF